MDTCLYTYRKVDLPLRRLHLHIALGATGIAVAGRVYGQLEELPSMLHIPTRYHNPCGCDLMRRHVDEHEGYRPHMELDIVKCRSELIRHYFYRTGCLEIPTFVDDCSRFRFSCEIRVFAKISSRHASSTNRQEESVRR